MSRHRCWICFNQLMYVKGKPVFSIVFEDGIEHKCHKQCAKDWKEGDRLAIHQVAKIRMSPSDV